MRRKRSATRRERTVFARGLRFLAGLALIPVAIGVCRALIDTLYALPAPEAGPAPGLMALAGGYLAWLAVWCLLPAPVKAYVFAHELTHALWALLWGARVSRLRVSSRGGSVSLSHSNSLILLAPYFFPLYTVLLIAAQAIAGLFVDIGSQTPWWLAGIGFTWGFHVTFTLRGLLQHQSDITACGRLFAYTLILVLNLLGVGLWVTLSSSVPTERFFFAIVRRTGETLAAGAQWFIPGRERPADT